MIQTEALRLALEALENITSVSICEATHHAKKDRHLLCEECPNEVRHLKAITAIKAALEAKDEPLAYLEPTASPDNACYTPPQRTWVGLTDDEQQQAYEQWQNDGWGVFYNAIEAKLKEKNS
jgi:hypothetical protein